MDISARYDGIPLDVARLLASIEGSRGREELYRAQAPQVLERLAARTRFDSITASSAIEDVILDDERALELSAEEETGPTETAPRVSSPATATPSTTSSPRKPSRSASR